MKKGMLSIFTFMGLAILAISIANADMFMEQNVVTEMMGKKTEEVQKIYIKGSSVRMESSKDDAISIVNLDKGVIWNINPKENTYSEMSLKDVMGVARTFSQMGGETKVDVTESDQTKKILNYNCKKYLVKIKMNMGTIDQEMWVTKDLTFDDYKKFAEYSDQFMPELTKEMEKIKGVPLEQNIVTNMGVFSTKSNIITKNVEHKNLDQSLFELPKGLKKVASPMEELKKEGEFPFKPEGK